MMMMGTRSTVGRLCLPLVALSLLALGALASAGRVNAAAWTPERVVSNSSLQTGTPDLASSSSGWTALSFTRFLTSNRQVLVAIKGPRKTRFGSPRLLSTPTLNSDDARVAVAPDGRVTVAWIGDLAPPATDTVVMVASKAKSARRFSRPLRLSPLGMGSDPDDLSISVGAKGRTVVAWAIENPDGDPIVQSARRARGNSPFVRPGPTQEISRPASRPDAFDRASLTALVAADGSYNYLWTGTGASIQYVRSAGRSATRQTVASVGNEREGTIAIARNGAATIVWTNGVSDVLIARRGSVRSAFTLRENRPADASSVGIGMARDGTSTIVYRAPLAGEWQPIALTRRPSQAQFGPEQLISPLGGFDPRVAVSPGGTVRVAFGRSASFLAPGVVQRGPRASSFGPPVALGPPDNTDSVRITTGGDGWSTVAWSYVGFGYRVLYSVARP